MSLHGTSSNNFIPAPFICEFTEMLQPDSLVLDMGAFEGDNGNYISQAGHRVISVELDFGAARRGNETAKAMGSYSVRNSFVCGDMLKPMFREESFDAVVSTIALQDLVPRESAINALRKILRLTKPGGLNLVRVYIGTERHRQIKSGEFTVFAPGELQAIYSGEGWGFVKPPFQSPLAEDLGENGRISSVAQVFARKPTTARADPNEFLKKSEYYRRSDPELSEYFLELAQQSS
jgi:SAM-dependent methyltransferase